MNQQAFSFYSYRDPNNTATLAAFDGAIEWARNATFTEQQLNEAKVSYYNILTYVLKLSLFLNLPFTRSILQISVVGKLDAPVAPGSRGLGEFLGGLNLEQRQAYRTG